MIVKDVLKEIGIDSEDNRLVKGVCFDSNKVEEGFIFVAYKGNTFDGNDYIYQAFEKGAVCVVSDRLVGYDIYKSNNIEKDKITLCQIIYKTNKVKLIGITGTNGKTSSAHIIYQALNYLKVRATYIGTLGVIDLDYYKELENTTPNIDVLAREIYLASKRGCKYVVMEVSSHALSLNRVAFLDFKVVAFTNLTQDHLDYYHDLESYFKAKKLLFDHASKKSIGIINNEDSYSKRIIKDFKGKVIRYGKKSEYDYKVSKNTLNELVFKIDGRTIHSKLIFKTNLYNLVLAYTIIISLGFDKDKTVKALEECKTINGRAQLLYKKDFYIILDYAHTPDAMERILKETNKIKKGKCVVLFGCGGNRDKGKRKIMGNIASTYADKIYLTDDNPRYEKEEAIIDDILQGIENRDKVKVIVNRLEAIKDAIASLNKEDVLLILGKGHEDYQIFKDKKIHFSDKEIVDSCIEK